MVEFFFFIEVVLLWITMNFPLRMAFAVSHGFWKVVFPFLFVSWYFLISLLTHSLLGSMLFSLYMFLFFPVFPLSLSSSFMLLWSEKILDMISVFLNFPLLVLREWPCVGVFPVQIACACWLWQAGWGWSGHWLGSWSVPHWSCLWNSWRWSRHVMDPSTNVLLFHQEPMLNSTMHLMGSSF